MYGDLMWFTYVDIDDLNGGNQEEIKGLKS